MQIWPKNNQMCFGLVFPIVWYMEHVHYWFADENLQWHMLFIFIYIFPSWRRFAKPLKSSWEHIAVWLCQKLQMFGVTQLIYAGEEIRLFNYYPYYSTRTDTQTKTHALKKCFLKKCCIVPMYVYLFHRLNIRRFSSHLCNTREKLRQQNTQYVKYICI